MIQQPDFQILTVWWLSNLSQYLIIFSNFFHPFLKYHVSDPVPGKRSGSAGFILYQDISSIDSGHGDCNISGPLDRWAFFGRPFGLVPPHFSHQGLPAPRCESRHQSLLTTCASSLKKMKNSSFQKMAKIDIPMKRFVQG